MVLTLNSRGPAVRELQILLNSIVRPVPLLKVDGWFGGGTEKALRIFQSANAIEADGVAGPATRAAMGMRSAAKSMPPPQIESNRSWLDIAAAEIGIRENAEAGQHTSRIVEYHATTTLKAKEDEVAWCSSFVNWVVIQSGGRGTNSAAARSWLNWGTKVENPERGCIIVVRETKKDTTNATGSTSGFHVGFLESWTSKTVRILGGNQSDRVKYSNFSLGGYTVKGYLAAP